LLAEEESNKRWTYWVYTCSTQFISNSISFSYVQINLPWSRSYWCCSI